MRHRSLPRRFWLWLVLALLFLALPLAWWLREPLAEHVLRPITNWFWGMYDAWQMVPQAKLWMGLVILSAAYAVFTLGQRARLNLPPLSIPSRWGRVGYWLGVLRMGLRARPLVIRPLRHLVVQVLTHTRNQTRNEVLTQLQKESLPFPKHVQAYLNERRVPRKQMDKAGSRSASHVAFDPELEEIVRILEDYLEVPHGS
ncbi:MAG TPA: hypothetical protein G4O08_07820 [Anaerolineae bacterium]|nr:hypothetical protein [Anaerolineae bacterium]